MTSGSTSLTQPAVTGRPVVGRDRDAVAAAPGLDDAEEPVLARRAEHHLDVAAALAQLGGEPEERGAAVAAADEDARHRLASAAGSLAERPDDVDRVVRRALDDPPGADADGRDDDLDGAAVGAAGADLVDREASAAAASPTVSPPTARATN